MRMAQLESACACLQRLACDLGPSPVYVRAATAWTQTLG